MFAAFAFVLATVSVLLQRRRRRNNALMKYTLVVVDVKWPRVRIGVADGAADVEATRALCLPHSSTHVAVPFFPSLRFRDACLFDEAKGVRDIEVSVRARRDAHTLHLMYMCRRGAAAAWVNVYGAETELPVALTTSNSDLCADGRLLSETECMVFAAGITFPRWGLVEDTVCACGYMNVRGAPCAGAWQYGESKDVWFDAEHLRQLLQTATQQCTGRILLSLELHPETVRILASPLVSATRPHVLVSTDPATPPWRVYVQPGSARLGMVWNNMDLRAHGELGLLP